MSEFDAYHVWLGISPDERPADYYRLLGISRFETNVEVIRNAADRQLVYVRRLAVNQYAEVGRALLSELARAKLCLLKESNRAEYDAKLRAQAPNVTSPAAAPAPRTVTESPLAPPDMRSTIQATRKPVATEHDTALHSDVRSTDAAVRGDETDSRATLTVGSHESCDIRLPQATVSGKHCQLLRDGKQLFVKDLGSRNGTYVNQSRVDRTVAIAATDLLTVGRQVRLRVPRNFLPLAMRQLIAVFVGRHQDNDVCIDDESVSSFHAQLIRRDGQWSIIDLNSMNGTRLFGPNKSVVKVEADEIRLHEFDSVRFGHRELPIATLLACSQATERTQLT